jgi:hypothetical protein
VAVSKAPEVPEKIERALSVSSVCTVVLKKDTDHVLKRCASLSREKRSSFERDTLLFLKRYGSF